MPCFTLRETYQANSVGRVFIPAGDASRGFLGETSVVTLFKVN